MLSNLLYSKNSAIKWLKSNNPEDEVVFSSVATTLETKDSAPVGWSFQRIFQHEGFVIITRSQLVVKNGISFFRIIFFGFLIFISLSMFQSRDFNSICGGILGLTFFSIPILRQCIPYERKIPLQDIVEVKLGDTRSITRKYQLFTVSLKDKTLNIVPVQKVPSDIVELLSAHAEWVYTLFQPASLAFIQRPTKRPKKPESPKTTYFPRFLVLPFNPKKRCLSHAMYNARKISLVKTCKARL